MRARPADIVFVALALVGGAVLLFLGRSLTFWHDEWRSITFDGGPIDYLRPVNEHWSTFHLVLYRATFRIVGLRSYIPYLAELVVLHLLAVAGAYALMRARVGPLVATLVAAPLLFLGSGAENLFWGFQTGFVGSVMFGVWALFFIERPSERSPAYASLLLFASLTASGIGLFFLVVAAGRTLSDSSLRRRAFAVLPPAAAYLVWFGLFGRDGVDSGGPVEVDLSVARFAVRGIVHSTQRVVGLDHLPDSHLWGLLLFLGLSTVTVYRIVRGRPPTLAVGCLLGTVAMYTGIAFVRVSADPGYDHATSSRFVYVAAFLLVLAMVDLLPARSSWSARGRGRAAVAAALAVCLLVAIVANLVALFDKRSEFQRTTDATRAFVALALARGNEPWVDRDAPRGWMPPISQLVRTIERNGSPLRDELFPGVVRAPSRAVEESALLVMIGDGFRVEDVSSHRTFAAVEVAVRRGSSVAESGQCVRARFGYDEAVWTRDLPAEAHVRLASTSDLAVRIFLAHEGGPGRKLDADLPAGAPKDVVLPDVGDGRPWTLVVDAPTSTGAVMLCVLVAGGERSLRAPTVAVRRWE